MRSQPVTFQWRMVDVVDGDGVATRVMAMVPLRRYGNVCKRQFGDGGEHTLEVAADRNMRHHNAFFAEINELFENIPEEISFMKNQDGTPMLDELGQKIARWPSSDHFRRWVLIEVGWCEEKEFECLNRDHAKNLGKFLRVEDDYSRIAIRGNRVVVKKARSQSLAAMGANDFEASKKDVLDLARAMVGVTVTESRRSAGRSA